MRFVARLAIAIAALLSSALLCWGQPPGAYGQSPNLAPPRAASGTWIDDADAPEADYDAEPEGDYEGGGGSVFGEDCLDSANCPDCLDGSCDLHDGAGAGAGGLGGLHGKKGCLAGTDLWTDVHSHHRMYFSVDYLSMWAKGNQLPPLVTTSPLGTVQSQAGVLPVSATTEILYGGQRVDLNQRNGGRINFGYWLVDGEFLGVEGQYWTLEPQNTPFSHTSTFSGGSITPNDIILARPFLNVDPSLPNPVQDASIIAFPDFNLAGSQGPLDGSIQVQTNSKIQSAGGLFRKLIWMDFTAQWRMDLLLGYRFFRTDDSVIIDDSWNFTPVTGPIGPVSFTSNDTFSAKNIFNGGEIGLKYQHYRGPVSLEFIGKCAFGNNHQVMYINGSNTITTGGQPTTNEGGLLTQASNIGTYKRDVFAVLPEADVNLRFDVTRNLRVTMGYTFVYMNRVQRSGNAINTSLNPTQIDGGPQTAPAEPSFAFYNDTFWVHGVSGGMEYRW